MFFKHRLPIDKGNWQNIKRETEAGGGGFFEKNGT